ncbi:DUF167 domain-containing protein [Candidatus Pacearchaeota archaeon]|nr:DUF167 domain-containing protein [Candidatus Pacearchaeota archaeon]
MGKIIFLEVKASSSQQRIEKIDEMNYRIWVMEHREKGKANKAILKIMARYFGISYKNIKIKNPLSRKKIIEIS